jgi:hypothetical protein
MNFWEGDFGKKYTNRMYPYVNIPSNVDYKYLLEKKG